MISLPNLREDLVLHSAPSNNQGAPSWSLQDPVRNLFFRIDWLSFEILSRWHLGDGDKILASIDRETTITTEADDLNNLLNFLSENELLQRVDANSSRWFAQRQQVRPSLANQLLHSYLFFRIPLWRPNAWLDRNQTLIAPLFSNAFLLLTLLALLLGLLQLSQQWQTFSATLIDFFSWQGMLAFALTIAFVKFFHELGHAFTAKRFGCQVPTMGLAFLLLLPMAYTDVNDVWKLRHKKQRLAVGAAGIGVELTIAAWATLAWSLLPDGQLRTAGFLLASTTWVSSLLINLSPFLRFDGYFLLMDWLEMPNLHQRSFELGKWWLQKQLFGFSNQPPEPYTKSRQRFLLIFCLATWLYRLVIFAGIAWLLYQTLPKPLGPVLALIELWWFIGMPVFREINQWLKHWRSILASRRSWFTGLLLTAILLVMALPWDGRIYAQGLLQPTQISVITAPDAAQISHIDVSEGSYIQAGATIMSLHSSDLLFQKRSIETKSKSLDWQLQASQVQQQRRENRQPLLAEKIKLQSELRLIDDELKRFQISAPFAGHFYFSEPDINTGNWVSDKEVLGTLIDHSSWKITAYVNEEQLVNLQLGDRARFYPESPGGQSHDAIVTAIEPDATRTLEDAMLASTHGGKLLVRNQDSQLIPERAHYRITLKLDSDVKTRTDQARILRGDLIIHGQPKSYLEDFFQAIAIFFVREASF
jgi:putative peptide zinc metalloprotease protein